MRPFYLGFALLVAVPVSSLAQSYTAPAPTDVPSSGTRGLNKADRKIACTQEADRRNLRGMTRQQYRAACRGRALPKRG